MFGSIGIFEIVLVGGVALMVLGPEKFPEFAKLSMRTVRDIRKYVNEAQRDIANELNPIKKEIGDIRRVDVEDYVEKLVGDDSDKSTDHESDSEMDDMDSQPYNPEPDPSVIDDWYPEEGDEIVAGADETAGDSESIDGSDEDSAQEHAGGTVPYGDMTAGDADPGYIEEPEGETGSREETTDESEPEKLDG